MKKKLSNSEDVLNSLGDALITTDKKGKITRMNLMAESLTGCCAMDVIGKSLENVLHIVHLPTGERLENLTEQVFKNGKLTWEGKNEKLIIGSSKAFPVAGNASIINDSEGNAEGIVMLIRDITEHKTKKESFLEDLKHLQSIFDSMQEGILLIDRDWRYLYINNAAENQGRRPVKDLMGKTVMECWPDFMESECFKLEQKVMRDRQPAQYIGSYTFPDDDIRWFQWSIQPAAEGILVVTQDVTEQKILEYELRRSVERFRNVFTNNMVPMGIWNKSGEIIEANDSFLALIGYTRENLETNHISFSLITKAEYMDQTSDAIREVEKFGFCAPFETVFIHNDGYSVPSLIGSGIFDEETQTGVFFAFDMTESKQAEIKLHESEEKYTALFRNSNIPAVLVRLPEAIMTDVNEALLKLTGFSREELTGKNAAELGMMSKSKRDEAISKLKNDKHFPDDEIKLITKSGEERIIIVRTNRMEINGQPFAISTLYDITERKRILKFLQESEIRFSALFRLNPSPIGITSADDYRIVDINDAWCEMTGFTKDEAIGRTTSELGLTRDNSLLQIREILKNDNKISHQEVTLFSRSGEERYVLMSSEQIEIGGEAFYLTNFIDITGRKEAEDKIHEREVLLRQVIESSQDAIFAIDRDYRLLINNNRHQQVLFESGSHYLAIGESVLTGDFSEKVKSYWQNVYDRALQGESFSLESSWTDTGGNFRTYENSFSPLYIAKGLIIGVLIVVHDITERKNIENELRHSEERFSTAFYISPVAQSIISYEKTEVLAVNDSTCNLFGYSREELIGLSTTKLSLWADQDKKMAAIKELQATNHLLPQETTIQTKSGEFRTVIAAIEPITWKGVPSLLSTIVDITERKQAEENLRESQKRFVAIFEHSPVAVAISRMSDGKVILVNKSTIDLTGFSNSEFIGHTTTEMGIWAIPADRERFVKILKSNQRIEALETIIRQKSGEKRNVLIWGELLTLDGEPCMMAEIIDITDRKQAEQKLFEREAELSYAQELAQMSSWRVDLSNYGLSVSKNYRKLIGILDENQEISFVYFLSRLHPDDVSLMDPTRYDLTPESAPITFDFRMQMPDGSLKWFKNTMVGEFSKDKLIALKGTNIDITDKKNQEEEIRKINETLEQRIDERTAELSDLYNNAPCGYHSLDINGVIELVNDTELKWLGYTREEIVGKIKASDLITEKSKEIFAKAFPTFKKQGKMEGIEVDFIRKDGSILPVLLNATAIYDEHGNFVRSRSTIIDHTERKKSEETLMEAMLSLEAANKELEAFSYSVSHDLRAPLRAIGGFSKILTEEYGIQFDDEGKRICNVILRNSIKMGTLIDDLLAFSRYGRSEMTVNLINMEPIIRSVIEELTTPENLQRIRLSIDPLPMVKADATLMKQVWINLLSNAIKYSSGKDTTEIEISSHQGENDITFKISDHGTGFEMEYVDKLFGVFQRLHTNKEFEGTGVGLAIVKRIINRHGGQVWAEGKLNEGATFYFTLPN